MVPPVMIAIESNGKSALAHAEEALSLDSFYAMGPAVNNLCFTLDEKSCCGPEI
jgi:hypothetical protein